MYFSDIFLDVCKLEMIVLQSVMYLLVAIEDQMMFYPLRVPITADPRCMKMERGPHAGPHAAIFKSNEANTKYVMFCNYTHIRSRH